jgi:hypothetical protein
MVDSNSKHAQRWHGLTLRTFCPGDEIQIATLLTQCFNERRTPEECHWKVMENPEYAGDPTVFIAMDGSSMVAHLGGMPVRLQADGHAIRALLLYDFAVLQACRQGLKKVGLFLTLARFGEEICCDHYKLFWGFPTPIAYRVETRQLGGLDAGEVPTLVCPLSLRGVRWLYGRKGLASIPDLLVRVIAIRRCLGHDTGMTVRQVGRLDQRVDTLWQNICDHFLYTVERDYRYLRWRYARPNQQYLILIAERQQDLLGYITFRTITMGSIRVGLIMDVMPPTEPLVCERLLCEAMLRAQGRGVDAIRCWMKEDCAFYDVLLKYGFVVRPSDDHLVYKVNAQDLAADAIGIRRNWYLTLSDCDGL